MLGPCFVLQYFLSLLILQSSRWEERDDCFTFIVFLGWSVICDCDISWSYSLSLTLFLLLFFKKTRIIL